MATKDMKLPEDTSLFWKYGRIKTFNNWPFKESDKCNVKCMVAAGFYVIGDNNEPDLVECFICGKQLNGWEPDDDPWSEHQKHQPTCQFLNLNKQHEMEWTVNEMYDLYKEFSKKEQTSALNKKIDMLKDEAAYLKSCLSDRSVRNLKTYMRHPGFNKKPKDAYLSNPKRMC